MSCLLILRGIIRVSGGTIPPICTRPRKMNPPMTRHKLYPRSTTKPSDDDHCISPQHARTHEAGKSCSLQSRATHLMVCWEPGSRASPLPHTHTRERASGLSGSDQLSRKTERVGGRERRQPGRYLGTYSQPTYSFPFPFSLLPSLF